MSHALINDLIIMQTHTEMRQTYFESKFSVKNKMSTDFYSLFLFVLLHHCPCYRRVGLLQTCLTQYHNASSCPKSRACGSVVLFVG